MDPRLDDVDQGEADGYGEGGRDGVVEDGADAHPADRSGSPEAGDAAHQRGEDERNDDHLQEAQKKIAEKAYALRRRRRPPAKSDTGDKGDQHLPVKLEIPGSSIRVVADHSPSARCAVAEDNIGGEEDERSY